MRKRRLAAPTAALLVFTVSANAEVDAISIRVNTEDADRFVALFEKSNEIPDAATLQAGYIDPGTEGLKIFLPGRIEGGDNLARAISENTAAYRRAIDVCLPIARASSGELRAVYLALEGLLGGVDLPEIYAVFGAGNSGGTVGPGAQVIGLEVICRDAAGEDEIKALLRSFYAHETVHTFQPASDRFDEGVDALTLSVIQEGVADYVAWLVTGRPLSPEREAWAAPREKEIWKAFEKDRRAIKELTPERQYAKGSPLFRWVANVGSPPKGWPGELGYWLGMKIASAYVDAADDKRAAIKELISMTDPDAIIERSGYAARF